ncbi:MAG: ATP-binding cassette domain-containing protein [Bdellovibrionales bacterium]|nr:ATP-binding cassette domain-containing protein [Bdellovibrionales bacterium]
MSSTLLQIKELKVHFPMPKTSLFAPSSSAVKAVDGVTLDVKKGETLGLVGESGCGKSTLGRAILQLIRSTSGEVVFDGVDLTRQWSHRFGIWRPKDRLRRLRQRMQIIFQDPYSALNPRMTIESIVSEPLKTFNILSGQALRQRVQELMEKVGLDPSYIRRYPHEFSGGQRQRIGIARAIALNPDFIIADEPISALDVSIQAQILNLLKKLQKEMGMTLVFIAHDLAAVRHISDRVAVMYLGKIVELGDTQKIIYDPLHPYTKALISSIPVPDPLLEKSRKRTILEGEIPSPIDPPSGCAFHTRCPIMTEACKSNVPKLRTISDQYDHVVSCDLV